MKRLVAFMNECNIYKTERFVSVHKRVSEDFTCLITALSVLK